MIKQKLILILIIAIFQTQVVIAYCNVTANANKIINNGNAIEPQKIDGFTFNKTKYFNYDLMTSSYGVSIHAMSCAFQHPNQENVNKYLDEANARIKIAINLNLKIKINYTAAINFFTLQDVGAINEKGLALIQSGKFGKNNSIYIDGRQKDLKYLEGLLHLEDPHLNEIKDSLGYDNLEELKKNQTANWQKYEKDRAAFNQFLEKNDKAISSLSRKYVEYQKLLKGLESTSFLQEFYERPPKDWYLFLDFIDIQFGSHYANNPAIKTYVQDYAIQKYLPAATVLDQEARELKRLKNESSLNNLGKIKEDALAQIKKELTESSQVEKFIQFEGKKSNIETAEAIANEARNSGKDIEVKASDKNSINQNKQR